MRTLGGVVFVVLFSTACAGMYGNAYSPRSGQAAAPKAAVYAKAVQAIEGLGMTAVTNDAAAGVVTSSWSCDEDDVNQCVARTRFYISISDDGSYTIENQCQQRATMMVKGAPFTAECDHADRRQQSIIDQQNAIADAMDSATGGDAPEPAQPAVEDKPKAAAMYCSDTTMKGICAKDSATCEERRTALATEGEPTACALVEGVVCFKAKRVSDGKNIKVCASNERLCGNSQVLYAANVEEYENVEQCL